MPASEEVLKYLRRDEFFPSLAQWSFTLEELYNQFPLIRSLIAEGVDISESPSMNFQTIQQDLQKRLGITVKTSTGKAKVRHNAKKMDFTGLSPELTNLARIFTKQKAMTKASNLEILLHRHYYNEILKHRQFGFGSEVKIYGGYRLMGWAADIADHCNSLLPIFERLMKREVFIFPQVDKPLKETISAANTLLAYLQTQQIKINTTDLTLDERDAVVGKVIKQNDGLLVKVGSHVLIGDKLLDTKENIPLILDFGEGNKELEPSWTIAQIFVQNGEKVSVGKIMTISSMTIQAQHGSFMKYFMDLYRQVGRIRQTAIFVKEVIEQEIRTGGTLAQPGGGGGGGGEQTSFKPTPGRFDRLDTPPEEIEEKAEKLDLDKKTVKDVTRKIRTTRSKLRGK